jgi:ketosteroid isomerase-like protein
MKRESIELLLDWLVAIRSGDVDRAEAAMAPDVIWRGTSPDLVCAGSHEVVTNFLKARDRLDDVEAIELIGRDGAAVLAAHGQDGPEIFNVFTFSDGQIVSIEDYARREDALLAASSVR